MVIIVYKVVRAGFIKKVIFEQSHLDIWGRPFQEERITCAKALEWEKITSRC